jgi:hypothetical protein
MSNSPTKRIPWPERRHCARRCIDGIHVHVNLRGEHTQRCKVRCISIDGIFIDPVAALHPDRRVELAYTCQYTRQLVKMYRRSAYVARVSENGVALVYSDKHRFRSRP